MGGFGRTTVILGSGIQIDSLILVNSNSYAHYDSY
jgi:hypothetical protein